MLIEFDTPSSVMHSDILSYMEVSLADGLYEPPIPFETLAKALRANAMHGSAIDVKRNMASYSVTLSSVLSKRNLKRFLSDYLTFGNAYLVVVRNVFNEVISMKHIPALFMRRREGLKGYTYKPKSESDEGRIDYAEGKIFHLVEYDACQEIYGMPQYVGALISIWLSEDATLFRRQYYINGSHAGYILYLDDPNMTDDQEKAIKKQLKKKGGLGAFKNLFIRTKGSNSKEPKLIPIAQVEPKDAFKQIKNETTNDILATHRVPLELMSVRKEGFSPAGDLNKIDRIFYKNELMPLLESVCEINEFVGQEIVTIKEYEKLSD